MGYNNLVKNIQREHDESLNLIRQFRKALSSRRKKVAEKIFGKLNETLARHFEFEENYLYPRMRRLILETTDKLCAGQEQIKISIKKSQRILDENKMYKNKLSTLTDTLEAILSHLEDCSDIVSLANSFDKEEENELGQRFKEFCKLNGSKNLKKGE